MIRILAAGTALVLGTLVAMPLLAHSAGPGSRGGDGWGHGPGMGRMGLTRLCEDRPAVTDAMLAYAKARLDITEAQEAAWTRFEQAVRNTPDSFETVCAQLAGSEPPGTLPERLARMEMIGEAGLAQLQALRPAVEEIYAALTPEQREIADGLARHGRRHGRF